MYEEDDVLDLRLLNQISKWIMYNRLPSLARHLEISDAEISRIMIPHSTPEEQCFQVTISNLDCTKSVQLYIVSEFLNKIDFCDIVILFSLNKWTITMLGCNIFYQHFQILKRWYERNTLTVKEVVESMVQWQQGRTLDPGVWNHLRPKMNPRLMPSPSVPPLRPPAKRKSVDIDLEYSVSVRISPLVFSTCPTTRKFTSS